MEQQEDEELAPARPVASARGGRGSSSSCSSSKTKDTWQLFKQSLG